MKIIYVLLFIVPSKAFISKLKIISSLHVLTTDTTKFVTNEIIPLVPYSVVNIWTDLTKSHGTHHQLALNLFDVSMYCFILGLNIYYNDEKVNKLQNLPYFKNGVRYIKLFLLVFLSTLTRNIESVI